MRKALVILASAAVVACTSMPHRSSEQKVKDDETAQAVQGALSADQSIYAKHITVRVENGVAYLGGFVWTDLDQYEARRIAESVAGVAKVVDQMELEREGEGNSPVSR